MATITQRQVPDLREHNILDIASGEALLIAQGFIVGIPTVISVPGRLAGVVAQTPLGKTMADPGSAVSFTINDIHTVPTNVGMVAMPDLSMIQSDDEAEELLIEAGIRFNRNKAFHYVPSGLPEGTFVRQFPEKGTLVRASNPTQEIEVSFANPSTLQRRTGARTHRQPPAPEPESRAKKLGKGIVEFLIK